MTGGAPAAPLWHLNPVSPPTAPLLSDVTREQADRAHLLLLSMDVPAQVVRGASGRSAVMVEASDFERAAWIIADEYPDGVPSGRWKRRSSPSAELAQLPVRWFGRGSRALLGLVAATIAIHFVVHEGLEGAARSRLLDAGAIAYHLIEKGELWRLLAAVFLHFNLGHLLSNMGTLLFVGPPLAQMVGPWRMLGIYVAGGVLANVGSHLFNPVLGLKAGASGAVAAALGALGGQAMRSDGRPSRLKSWQALGAMAAAYGLMIGFGPGRDNVAHIVGILAGIALGRFVPPLDSGPPERSERPS